MATSNEIKVWDPLVRLLHWTLVLAFVVAYVSGEEWLSIHVFAGYTILGIVIVRVLWGFVGTHHARFSTFVRPPSVILDHIKSTLMWRAKRYLGHNPTGGLMILLMLAFLLAATFTGLLAYGAEEHAGPFAQTFTTYPEWFAEGMEELHEFFANASLALVLLHVAGVLLESLILGENLTLAMITGRKRA